MMKSKATSHFFFTKFKEIDELREIMGKQVKVIDIVCHFRIKIFRFYEFHHFRIVKIA